jgi:ketosteroid isomerase-like protein
MNVRRVVVAMFALAIAPAIASAQSAPPEAIVRLSNVVVHAGNTGDGSSLAHAFTPDATVVDENAPFVWRGSSAGADWWGQLAANMKRAHLSNMRVTNVHLGEYRHSVNGAYLVQSMTISGLRAGKPFAESGTMTYTFHEADGSWWISSMVWSTKP